MKRINYKIAVWLVLFLAFIRHTEGQDMNYSQYFSVPIYYNPAYTGISTGLRARFLYRSQWPALPVSLKSYLFTADLGDRLLPGAGGIGLIISQDSPGFGLINNFNASLNVAARITINENLLANVGIKAGILQRRINWEDLIFPSQLDPYLGIDKPSPYNATEPGKRLVPDFGAGGVLQFRTPDDFMYGNAGFGIDHIFQPDVSFLSNGESVYPRKFTGQFEITFNTSSKGFGNYSASSSGGDDGWRISTGAIYQNQHNLGALQIGLTVLKYNIYVGTWYKNTFGQNTNSALAVLGGYRYNFDGNISVRAMYSYDIQISRPLQGTGGAHEISLVIEMGDVGLFSGGGGGGGYGGSSRGAFECPTFY